jgi:carboxypeptidase Taq
MSPLQKVRTEYRDLTALHASVSLLNWDRQVLMPSGGSEARSIHIGRLTALAHQRLLNPSLRRAVEDARAEVAGDAIAERELALIQRQIDQASKLPLKLITRKAEIASQSYEVWRRARPSNDFDALRPYLMSLFDIAQETSSALGYTEHPYDPLLDLYEEGTKTSDVIRMFDQVKPRVSKLIRDIKVNGARIDATWLNGSWETEPLRRAAQNIGAKIGFDYSKGRLDLCANAFCTTVSMNDVRMTTRPGTHIKGVLSSSLHELGHGLYEQNGNPDWSDTSLAGGASLAVHESQSRMWENIIGRSKPFWRYFFTYLQAEFPTLASKIPDQFYAAFTAIQPGWLRVGADELSYNMHILVRFEIEVEILTNKLQVRDMPEAWNAKMKEYVGVSIESDGQGCLQDVHWSKGSIGYFPTYAMGNLIGGQIWEKLRQQIPAWEEQLERGDTSQILAWLTEKIYVKASSQAPRDLVTGVCGDYLNPNPWLEYVEEKYSGLYGLN